MNTAVRRPFLTAVLTLILIAVGGFAAMNLPRELVPHGRASALVVRFSLPSGLVPEARGELLDRYESVLRGAAASSSVGEPDQFVTLYRGREEGRRVLAREAEQGTSELVWTGEVDPQTALPALREALLALPALRASIEPRRSAVVAALERSRSRVEIDVSAATPQRAKELALRVDEHLQERLGAATRRLHQGRTGEPRRQEALYLSWNERRTGGDATAMLGAQVQAGLGGFEAGRIDLSGVRPEILLESTRPEQVELLPVRVGEAVVPLAAAAAIEQRPREAPLERSSARPSVRLALSDARVDAATARAALAELPRSVDENVVPVGQAAEQERSFVQLRQALTLALILVFLTVAALYESLRIPLAVMVTLPTAAAGALIALSLAGQSLNVMSLLGIILLTGIVVNNAIVLIHRIGELGDVAAAAAERYRPILMTTLTTLLGMIPLAALGGEGVELRRSLATAVSGGLVASFLATLIVVPAFARWAFGERIAAGDDS